jgi:hypothetical protein
MADDDMQSPELDAAADALVAVRTGAMVLKVVAGIAFGLWILAVVVTFWNWWELSDTGSMTSSLGLTTGSMDNERILQVLVSTLQSTWGYLIAAVLAYTGSMLLHAQRLRLLVDAASAADD